MAETQYPVSVLMLTAPGAQTQPSHCLVIFAACPLMSPFYSLNVFIVA